MHEISVVPIKHVLHYCSITSPTGPYFFFPEPWDRLEIGNGPSFSVLLRSLLLLLQVLSPSADSESTPMEGQVIEELTLEALRVPTIIGSDYNFLCKIPGHQCIHAWGMGLVGYSACNIRTCSIRPSCQCLTFN